MAPQVRAGMTDIDTSVEGTMRVRDTLTLEQSGRWYRFDGSVREC